MDSDFSLDQYDYELPEELIAQHPCAERGASRLMVLDLDSNEPLHSSFSNLKDHLPAGALLVANNTKVAPARLYGTRPSGGKAELLLLTPPPLMQSSTSEDNDSWNSAPATALLKPGKSIRVGDELLFGPDIRVQVLEKQDFGRHETLFSWRGKLDARLRESGHMPLPPYIKRAGQEADKQRYQTVYSRADKAGSVAAPTAGLHFTPQLRAELEALAFSWAEVTLHVGYGTFSPVREGDIRKHLMHKEFVEVPPQTAKAVQEARAEGRAVIAVGTTSARSLEGTAQLNAGRIPAQGWQGWTDIFMYPGFEFKVIDGLITNFHLPKSSLLMLVSALAGRERVLSAYREARDRQYRFFSYGDAMLIKRASQ